MTLRKKLLITIACLSCILCVLVTGTVAWLIAESQPIVNKFTPSDINVELVETEGGEEKEFQMVPGKTIAKNPTVQVAANSEDCYVFVKVEKANDLDDFITYAKAEGWYLLTGVSEEIYYRKVGTADTVQEFPVLAGNAVTVKSTVTKAMMEGLTAANYPTLTFTAYAIQSEYLDYTGATNDDAKALVAWNTLHPQP